MHKDFFYISFICLCLPLFGFSQITIEGQIELDSTWRKEIFLSEIPSLKDMYKCSNQLIIGSSVIDSAGNWSITIPSQREPKLVRLHVSKKTYPKASLIIGGKDENYGFLAIYKNSPIKYSSKKIGDKQFSNFSFANDSLNKRMRDIMAIEQKWNNLDGLTEKQDEKSTLRKVFINELLTVADTTSHILPAIYAAHISDFGFNKDQVYKSMARIRNRLGEHSYLDSYIIDKESNMLLKTLIIVIGFLVLLGLFYKAYVVYTFNLKKNRLNSLSVREREIFDLVKQGGSNKEIASKLNIEVSTVKRHINSIFSKLKIKSRVETNSYKRLIL
ncbi:MAG: helix-turn-helix transcriptional regulator [Flavobacteriaceae bacterium]|nr:helix-turn-helix transcriptional regulator [Flavobacteriaceae bacterium]